MAHSTVRSDTPALLLLGLLLIGAPQLYGGVFAWSIVAITCIAVAALIAALRASPSESTSGTPWVALAIAAACVFTLVQAAPLPCGLVGWLVPESASELRTVLALVGAPSPAWCTLSRDPGSTRLEVLKGAAIAASFLAAWRVSRLGNRDRVIALCAWSTLVMSAVAHAHMAIGLEEVFGIYRPLSPDTGLQLAPLMNSNTLGAFAAFGVPLWLGILQRERELRVRAIAALAVVIVATTAVLSLSRGAIAMLTFVIALMVVVSVLRARRSSGERRRERRLLPGLAFGTSVAVGVGFGAWLAAERVVVEFEHGGTDKLALIGKALRLAAEHPWVGIGRGAFASTFLASGETAYFTHAENFVAQWASEWGFPLTLLLLAALAHALWFAIRGARSSTRLSAIVALFGLAAQNLFDLGSELLGVAVVAAALLGAAVAHSRRSENATVTTPWVPAQRFAVAVAACSATVLLWLGPTADRDSTIGLEDTLRSQLDAKDREAFRDTLERGVRLHPREPVLAVLAAAEALTHNDPRAVRWIDRGMELAPGWTAPHLQAFEWLWRIGRRSQALLELRAAAEIHSESVREYVCIPVRSGMELALGAAVPRRHDDQRAHFLEMATGCLPLTSPVVRDFDAMLRAEFPDRPEAYERNATRLAYQGLLDAALSELDGVQRRHPARTQTKELRVRLLFGAKRYTDAARVAMALASTLRGPDAEQLWIWRARALAELGDDAGWTGAVAALRRNVNGDIDRLADAYAVEGELYRKRGQTGSARRAYSEAFRIKADSRYLATVAGLSLEMGDRASALRALMQLCELEPEKNYCSRRDSLIEEGRATNFGLNVRN